ncbi:gene transfer agent family protein, partial [Fulvimarina sp. 2208YS6-2-32]
MTPHRAFFGDGDFDFALQPDQIAELERLTGVGIGALCRRLFAGDFAYSDLTNTLRLALIGGGLDPKEASDKVAAYAPMQSLSASMLLATSI